MVAAAYVSKTAYAREIWDQLDAERKAWEEMVLAFQRRTGYVVIYNVGPYSDPLIRGIKVSTGTPIPDGWTQLKRNVHLTPIRARGKTNEASEIAEQMLKSLAAPRTRAQAQQLLGIPMVFHDTVFDEKGQVWSYGSHIERLGDLVYVTFNCPRVDWEGGEHFERIPLSRYFTAVEELEASP